VSTVHLKSLKDLERVLGSLGWAMERGIQLAAWKAAQWGEAQAVRASMRSGVNASQTYSRSWISRRVKDGAIVANSAKHAYFVERGRKPGKGPPIEAIEVWIKLKKLMPDKPPKVSRQAARKAVIGKGPSGNISGAKQRARLRKDVELRTKIYRSDFARAQRHRMAIKAMALAISRKIARRGTKARFILAHLLQPIGSRYHREIKRELAKLSLNPPR
jgi:hypothetical protein